ncbi:MAG: hypothetical protein ACLUGJ_09965 [Blautia wexlerae]
MKQWMALLLSAGIAVYHMSCTRSTRCHRLSRYMGSRPESFCPSTTVMILTREELLRMSSSLTPNRLQIRDRRLARNMKKKHK